jgi:putative spermidine/putrescine transport system permease protein
MTNHQSFFASRLSRFLVWVAIGFFVLNVLALIAAVVVNSFATSWLGAWLPSGFTLRWYSTAWTEFQLDSVLTVTIEVVFAVVAISLLIGVPAAYALARRNFRFKRAILLLFVLPLLVPPMTYGIPLATLLYSLHLGGTITGVILGNLVPAVPFVILVMTPFIEQIDPKSQPSHRKLD